jgi:putative cell wall-binding protein
MKQSLVLAFLILVLLPAVGAQGKVAILTSDHASDHAVSKTWADKIGATLVVTPWGELSNDAVDDLKLSQADLVYIIGGEVAIPGAIDALEKYDWTIISVGGTDRQETSQNVAERFGAKRAVVLDGFDTGAMDEALTLARAEEIPIIFFHTEDTDFGAILQREGIIDVNLISNPTLNEAIKSSISQAGITITEIKKDEKDATQKMIDRAEERINESLLIVRSIKDGLTLAGSSLIVDAEIKLKLGKDALKTRDYEEAFTFAVLAEESADYGTAIYNGRIRGRITEIVAQANSEIQRVGVAEAKEDLEKVGASYGIGIPVPPIMDLASLMVDIGGYTKNVEQGSGLGFEYDIVGKYTKTVGQTVNVEIYEQPSEADAIEWAGTTAYSEEESRDWENTTFIGYPASQKSITVPVTDNINQEVFLRVAVGKLGVFTKFSQNVRKTDADILLLHPLVAQEMVEEVTAEIIKEIEANQ